MHSPLSPEEANDLRHFGRRLAALRRARGWSQERLALESGLARSYLGGVERGQRNIALLNILKLARTLACEPGELFLLDG
jgi:transcriptional regulator with XRE-family HTH domain